MDQADWRFGSLNMTKGPVVRIRCPHCRHLGTFDDAPQDFHNGLASEHGRIAMVRRCPNEECLGVVFVIANAREPLFTLPPETIDFDASNLPASVLESLEEAVTCLATGCYRAAAVMVRRTIEMVCEDQGATGKRLADRLKALGGAALVPAELIEGLDNLRLLGNDAVHVELKTFDQIGPEEAELGLEVTKELLKAVYQYGELTRRLKALQRQTEAD